MAVYFVTASDTENWNDDPTTHFSRRSLAEDRIRELLTMHPVVRLIRWERDQPVKEERFTPNNPP
jgi:hypothetical protein